MALSHSSSAYDREHKLLRDMHAVMTTPTDGKDGYNGGQRPFLTRFESATDEPASPINRMGHLLWEARPISFAALS